MEKFKTSEIAELVHGHLRGQSIQSIAQPHTALYRRLYDITHGKTQTVSLSVFDQLCVAVGRPDWLQVIEPL